MDIVSYKKRERWRASKCSAVIIGRFPRAARFQTGGLKKKKILMIHLYLFFFVSVAFPFCQDNRISTTVEQVRAIVTRDREHVLDLLRERAKAHRCACV